MSKHDEINYIATVADKDGVPLDSFVDYLARKPYSDRKCWEYLSDIAQILKYLPPPPARLLDLGCGSGWTSEIFARCGYETVGLDISPDFLKLAQKKVTSDLKLQFFCHDYEEEIPFGLFDCAVIFDALHHADNPRGVIHRTAAVVNPGGVLIILEPGVGHAATPDSQAVIAKYGTTEKDMPYFYYKPFLAETGFGRVRQFLRIRQLDLVSLDSKVGPYEQIQLAAGTCYETVANGLTSLVVADKS